MLLRHWRRKRRRHRHGGKELTASSGIVVLSIFAGAGLWGYAIFEIATRAS